MEKILIIDDEKSIRLVLKKWFEDHGYETICVENAKKGLMMFNQDNFDLVVVDLIMPDKEGLETIRELKKLNSSIKIFAISGGGINEPELYLSLAEKFGAVCTFQKPIIKDELLKYTDMLL